MFSLAACAHEAENTGVENSSVFTIPTQTYAFEVKEHAVPPSYVNGNAAYVPGRISRYQRQEIVIQDTPVSANAAPSAQYFDDVMDHLEVLMADKIRENNEIAALQEQTPGYEF